jgi:hypothetical protein
MVMNERIQDLWDKAAKSTAAYPSGQNNSWETQVNFMDRFAELIVRECIDNVRRVGILEDIESETDMVANSIKEHFGVKEYE